VSAQFSTAGINITAVNTTYGFADFARSDDFHVQFFRQLQILAIDAIIDVVPAFVVVELNDELHRDLGRGSLRFQKLNTRKETNTSMSIVTANRQQCQWIFERRKPV